MASGFTTAPGKVYGTQSLEQAAKDACAKSHAADQAQTKTTTNYGKGKGGKKGYAK